MCVGTLWYVGINRLHFIQVNPTRSLSRRIPTGDRGSGSLAEPAAARFCLLLHRSYPAPPALVRGGRPAPAAGLIGSTGLPPPACLGRVLAGRRTAPAALLWASGHHQCNTLFLSLAAAAPQGVHAGKCNASQCVHMLPTPPHSRSLSVRFTGCSGGFCRPGQHSGLHRLSAGPAHSQGDGAQAETRREAFEMDQDGAGELDA